MGQKVIIRFWWESGLSSASRNHLATFCSPFVPRAYARRGFEVNPPWVWYVTKTLSLAQRRL